MASNYLGRSEPAEEEEQVADFDSLVGQVAKSSADWPKIGRQPDGRDSHSQLYN